MKRTALIVIDPQIDYFEEGLFPLWNTQATLINILAAMNFAKNNGFPIVFIQHVANDFSGKGPFFNPNTKGVDIHSDIMACAPNAPIVVKHFADAFEQTDLQKTLDSLGIEKLILCGMMTQNCVTHTAISKSAEQYEVEIIGEACTTREELLHLIALNAISTRVRCVSIKEAFPE